MHCRLSRTFYSMLKNLLSYLVTIATTVLIYDVRGGPLEEWHWRNPLPQGNALHNVVWVNGHWLALGELGTILISNDGTNWSRVESGVADNLRDCAYGDGKYVIVGDWGTVLTSTNGISWSQQYAGTFYSLNAVCYANTQFVAVGESCTILTSPDGVVWTQQSSGEWELFDVVHGEGLYVVVGGVDEGYPWWGIGVVLTSPDAKVWTRRVFTPKPPFTTVAYANGKFVAASASQVCWSDDGLTWQFSSSPAQYGLVSLSYGHGNWVLGTAYPSFYYGYASIFTSGNLIDWSEVAESPPVTGIAFGQDRFVASRPDGTFLISSNGQNWANPLAKPLSVYFRDLEYINGSFCALDANLLVFSPDGTVWTNIVVVTNTEEFVSITFGNGRYVAGGKYRTVWTSTNGVDWTNPAPELSTYPYGADVFVAYGNGVFVGAAGENGDILTSPDGINWTVQQLITNATVSFHDVKFGDGRFVAVADQYLATSIDGTNWSVAYFPDRYFKGATRGNGMYVLIGRNTIGSSNDGTNWVFQTFGQSDYLQAVAFGSGFFVAVGEESYISGTPTYGMPPESPILISPDGRNWWRVRSKTARPLSNVAYGNGTFVITGGAGAILQSDPLVNLTITKLAFPRLELSGPVNRSYRIEYADGLDASSAWLELATVTVNEIPAFFNDPSWTNSTMRFYRAVLLP